MHLKIDARAAGPGVLTRYKPSPVRNTAQNTNQHQDHETERTGAYCRSRGAAAKDASGESWCRCGEGGESGEFGEGGEGGGGYGPRES